MRYDIEEPIMKFNEFLNKYGTSLEYEGDKFIVKMEDEEEEDLLWDIEDFIREKLCISLLMSQSQKEYLVDTETMSYLDKIWSKLGEEFYRSQVEPGFMNETGYLKEENKLKLNLRHYNEEIITKIKNALNAKTWYIVFDGWAEDMYIIYKL